MKLEQAVQLLVDAGVDFVIIGGWSAILHGSPYMTNDLDICYSDRRENLKRMATALAPYHPRLRALPVGLPFVWDEVTLRNGRVFTLETDLGIIDLLAEVSGVGSFQDVRAGAVETEAFGRKVWILDLPALIKAKRAAGRKKDLELIPVLEALLEAREG